MNNAVNGWADLRKKWLHIESVNVCVVGVVIEIVIVLMILKVTVMIKIKIIMSIFVIESDIKSDNLSFPEKPQMYNIWS